MVNAGLLKEVIRKSSNEKHCWLGFIHQEEAVKKMTTSRVPAQSKFFILTSNQDKHQSALSHLDKVKLHMIIASHPRPPPPFHNAKDYGKALCKFFRALTKWQKMFYKPQ